MVRREFRPIDTWPWPLKSPRERQRSRFDTAYGDTLDLLDRELDKLGARTAQLCLALGDNQIRQDRTGPYADARPDHPGVMVVCDSRHGPLRYATDEFTDWQDNLRAIALGLEALRKVDRYGITRGGEQYRGFAALPAGSGVGTSLDDAVSLLARLTDWSPHVVRDDPKGAFKAAAKRVHPDVGGDPQLFLAARDALAVIEAHS